MERPLGFCQLLLQPPTFWLARKLLFQDPVVGLGRICRLTTSKGSWKFLSASRARASLELLVRGGLRLQGWTGLRFPASASFRELRKPF